MPPTVCLQLAQARVVAQALARFESLKQAYGEKAQAGAAKDVALDAQGRQLQAKDSVIASAYRSLSTEIVLRMNTETTAKQARAVARRRGWVVAGLTTLAGFLLVR